MSAPATTIAVLAIAIVFAAQLASVASPQPRQVRESILWRQHMDPSIEHEREVKRGGSGGLIVWDNSIHYNNDKYRFNEKKLLTNPIKNGEEAFK